MFRLIYTSFFDLYLLYVNGPAVYLAKALRALKLHSTRLSSVAELNVKLLRQRLTYVELPSQREIGLKGSTWSSLGNLIESMRVFLQQLADVCVRQLSRFDKRPRRIHYGQPLHQCHEPRRAH